MAKGEDAIKRKKNRANRKKLQKKQDSSTVSARVAAIIAAKKRRKAGKRRICQGMCFSLPTLDDPFNDRHGKDASSKNIINGKSAKSRKGAVERNDIGADPVVNIANNAKRPKNEQERDLTSYGKPTKPCNTDNKLIKKSNCQGQQGHAWENSCSSKFLTLCLKTLEDALWRENAQNGEMINPLFVNAWGIEFWKLYASGKDILETSGVCSSAEQIAWIVSIAADSFARKEKEGLSLTSPFLLYLVPTAEKAVEVRAICKPLKALGIHTVSIHSSASIDHQIHGLTSCEPEFLVSTPERLLELITLKAIDVSQTSLLVVDGVSTFSEGAYLDMIKSVRQFISGNPRTVVFNDCLSCPCTSALQNLLNGPIERLSLNDSITSLSLCIVQSANVCTSEEEKLLKGFQLLDLVCGSKPSNQLRKVLYAVGNDNELENLLRGLEVKGYSISSHLISESEESKMKPKISVVSIEQLATADIGHFEVVLLPDFVPSIDTYVSILTRMARNSVNGVLLSFLTEENARLAEPLIKILEQCHQVVPESLLDLALLSSRMDE